MKMPIKSCLFIFLVLLSTSAHAGLCAEPMGPKDEFKNAAAVFFGSIQKVKPLGKMEIWSGNSARVSRVTFAVERAFKGVAGNKFSIHVYSSDSQFRVGKKYLIYARSYGERGLIGAFDCNNPINPSDAESKHFKELEAAAAASTGQGM